MRKLLLIILMILSITVLSVSAYASTLSDEYILNTYLEKYKNNNFCFKIDGYEPIEDDFEVYSMIDKNGNKIFHPVMIDNIPCYQTEYGELYYGNRLVINNMGTLDKEVDGILIDKTYNRSKYLTNEGYVVYYWGTPYSTSDNNLSLHKEYIVKRYMSEVDAGNYYSKYNGFITPRDNNTGENIAIDVLPEFDSLIYKPVKIDGTFTYQSPAGSLYRYNELIVEDVGTLDQEVPGMRIAKGINFSVWYNMETNFITVYSWGDIVLSLNLSFFNYIIKG